MTEETDICEQCKHTFPVSELCFWDCWCMVLCYNCLDGRTEAYKQGYRDGERGLKR